MDSPVAKRETRASEAAATPADSAPRHAIASTKLSRWAALAVVVGIAWWARGPLQAADLPFEDGTCLFQRHFQEFSVAAWFEPWNYYASLLPNMLASFLCRLPVAIVPHAFVVTSCLLNLIVCTVLLSRRYESVAPQSTRALIAVLWAWLPLGDWLQLTSLMYSFDPMLLLLALELLRPAGRPRMLVDPLIAAVLTWTHPLSLALVPISAWRVREPTMRPLAVTHIVASISFFLFGRVATDLPDVARILHAPEWLAVRVGFESFGGTTPKLNLFGAGMGWVAVSVGGAVLAAATLGVLVAWRRWNRQTRVFVVGLAWLILASAVAAVVVRDTRSADQWGHHHWIGRVALVAILCIVATTWVPPWLILLAALPWGWHVAAADWRHGPFERTPGLDAFLVRVAEQERERGGRRALDVEFVRPGLPNWGIVLKPR